MGLRFRKTISLLPGVRLNISKSGVGVSAGVPGLRGSINTSGRVTGTASIPGTGVSYVKTKQLGSKKKKTSDKTKTSKTDSKTQTKASKEAKAADGKKSSAAKSSTVQIDEKTLKSIHGTGDAKIEWKKILDSTSAEGFPYDNITWGYLRNAAPSILSGDIDTYLQVIFDINPLNDLMEYGSDFEFGTDNPDIIEVEFVINDAALSNASKTLDVRDFNNLLQDFVCSMAIRIARDMFALLPVKDTVVHVVLGGTDVFSVDFDADSFAKLNFSYIDPSNTATKFRNNMSFDPKSGFSAVNRL